MSADQDAPSRRRARMAWFIVDWDVIEGIEAVTAGPAGSVAAARANPRVRPKEPLTRL